MSHEPHESQLEWHQLIAQQTGRPNHPLQVRHTTPASHEQPHEVEMLTGVISSIFFRNNYVMLGAVFAGAFAFQMYVQMRPGSMAREFENRC